MRLTVLASSSAGNSALITTSCGQHILIDAGFSFKRMVALLSAQGLAPAQISALLLTHEHADHASGLSGFAALGTPIYTTRGTAGALQSKVSPTWQLIPSQAQFALGGIAIESFPIPHDAAEPVGFALTDADERLVWALDMGHLAPSALKVIHTATTLVIESNYCPKLLAADTTRPFALKQRIQGRHGHLSNDDTFEFICAHHQAAPWQRIILAHLSRQCNDPITLEGRYNAAGIPVEIISPHTLVGV